MSDPKAPPETLFAEAGHLGGTVKADAHYPHGDPLASWSAAWDLLLDGFRLRTLLDIGSGEP